MKKLHFKNIEPDLFNQEVKTLTDKEIELQELMFNNSSANRIAARKKYYKNKKFKT